MTNEQKAETIRRLLSQVGDLARELEKDGYECRTPLRGDSRISIISPAGLGDTFVRATTFRKQEWSSL